jgi:hypothetical protein
MISGGRGDAPQGVRQASRRHATAPHPTPAIRTNKARLAWRATEVCDRAARQRQTALQKSLSDLVVGGDILICSAVPGGW